MLLQLPRKGHSGGGILQLAEDELAECFGLAAGDVAAAPLGSAAAGTAFVIVKDFTRQGMAERIARLALQVRWGKILQGLVARVSTSPKREQ